jgi:hypothetical protein
MLIMMIASRARSPSKGICTPPRVMTVDVSIAPTRAIPFFPPSLLRRQRKVSKPTNRELCQQRIHVSHLKSSFQIEYNHIKLDIFVDIQEPFKTSHHKVALDYVEETMSLVEEQILSTSDISLSDNSDSSAGNASTAFESKYYEIEADAP